MQKLTGSSGFRAARGGGGAGPRVNASVMRNVSFLPRLRRAAFLPDTPQEQTFDSKGSRLQGLEQIQK